MIDTLLTVCSVFGVGGIIMFFIKRYFDRRDRRDKKEQEKRESLLAEIRTSLGTIRLLSYARLSEEIEKLLSQGYASPAERRFLDELYKNYKAHGWNGDMDERLKKVYAMRTDKKE